MEKREDTPERVIRRKYEETHKEERRQKTKVWGTSIDRADAEEIDAFLERYGLRKLDIIYNGFEVLKKLYEPSEEDKKKDNKSEGNSK